MPQYHYADRIETIVFDGFFPRQGTTKVRRWRGEYVTADAATYRLDDGRWFRMGGYDPDRDEMREIRMDVDGIYAVELPDVYTSYDFFEVRGRKAHKFSGTDARLAGRWRLTGDHGNEMHLVGVEE